MAVKKEGMTRQKQMEMELKALQDELQMLENPPPMMDAKDLTPSAAPPAPTLEEAKPGKEASAAHADPEHERALEEKQKLLEEIEVLRRQKSRLSNSTVGSTPSPRPSAPTPKSSSPTPTPSVAPSHGAERAPDSDEDGEDSGEKITRDDRGRLLLNGKLMSDAAVEQRLRRWCTKKKNGGLKCSQDVYERYHNQGPDARLELIQIFKDAFLNKDQCQSSVRKLVVEETGKTLKVQAGWYTERQMKDTLKMPKREIDAVTAYTADRPKLRRKWKYNPKIEQHYIEVDESGELTKRYTQTKEEEEICGSARPVEFRTLSLEDPAAMDRGAEEEAAADPPGSEPRPPNADVEKQETHVLLTKSMEALLAKSAKLRDIESKVENSSVKSILKTAYEAMDTHYDALATSLARYRAVKTKPSDTLAQNIDKQLEYAEVLGSKATRAEVQAQPALKSAGTKRKSEHDDTNSELPAPKVPKSKAKSKAKAKSAK